MDDSSLFFNIPALESFLGLYVYTGVWNVNSTFVYDSLCSLTTITEDIKNLHPFHWWLRKGKFSTKILKRYQKIIIFNLFNHPSLFLVSSFIREKTLLIPEPKLKSDSWSCKHYYMYTIGCCALNKSVLENRKKKCRTLKYCDANISDSFLVWFCFLLLQNLV